MRAAAPFRHPDRTPAPREDLATAYARGARREGRPHAWRQGPGGAREGRGREPLPDRGGARAGARRGRSRRPQGAARDEGGGDPRGGPGPAGDAGVPRRPRQPVPHLRAAAARAGDPLLLRRLPLRARRQGAEGAGVRGRRTPGRRVPRLAGGGEPGRTASGGGAVRRRHGGAVTASTVAVAACLALLAVAAARERAREGVAGDVALAAQAADPEPIVVEMATARAEFPDDV